MDIRASMLMIRNMAMESTGGTTAQPMRANSEKMSSMGKGQSFMKMAKSLTLFGRMVKFRRKLQRTKKNYQIYQPPRTFPK